MTIFIIRREVNHTQFIQKISCDHISQCSSSDSDSINIREMYLDQLSILTALYFHSCTLCTGKSRTVTVSTTERTNEFAVLIIAYIGSNVSGPTGLHSALHGGPLVGDCRSIVRNTHSQLKMHVVTKPRLEQSLHTVLRTSYLITLDTKNFYRRVRNIPSAATKRRHGTISQGLNKSEKRDRKLTWTVLEFRQDRQ